uniref:Tetratricopeptide repeat protein 21B n=1 Tax=Plectus sambesii TaxID=2011161 RepID=A0A914W2S6_9BILA
MSESDLVLQTALHFYARQGYNNHVRQLAEENLRKFVNDPVLQFFYGYSQMMQGQIQEAIRAFSNIKEHPDVALGALLGMSESHKRAKNIDREAVSELDARIRDVRRSANDKSNYYGAVFLYLTGAAEKAREMIDKAQKSSSQNHMLLCLKGWIDLTSGRDMKAALKSFEDALSESKGHEQYLDPWLGQARYHEQRHNAAGMMEALNHASAKAANFLPVHTERLKALLMKKEWDQCVDAAQQCLIIDSDSIEAHSVICLHTICFEGHYAEAESLLSDLVDLIDRKEPRNAPLCIRMAELFSRISGRNPNILQHTKALCEKALSANRTAEHQAELAKQLRMLGQNKVALKAYRQALEMEASTPDSLLGIVSCYLADGNLSDAQAQVDFVKAAHQEAAGSVMLIYMEALIAKRKHKSYQEVTNMFKSVIDAHFSKLQSVPFGLDYFRLLEPDFVLDVVTELFDYVSVEPAKPGSVPDSTLKEIQRILAVVNDACPGLSDATYLLGKCRYLAGESDAAQKTLTQCLEKDQTFADAHLLMAQIFLQKNNFKQASQSLEVGLSFNFQVRDHPLYHLIKARIQKRSNHMEGAVQQLEAAMALPGFKSNKGGGEQVVTKAGKTSRLELTESDRVAIYLELIDCLQALNRTEEATKLMHTALEEFKGTNEEERLMLCNADLALARGDADKALSLLQSVLPEQSNYLAARQKMAEIYLHHKKDKRQFAICYKELVEKNPSPQAFVLLGDAYMSIQEPERAIEVYEAALKRNPKDHALARKIGQAYVQAHLYAKAVNYYEAALKTGQQSYLRQDLAELLFRLRNFEKCQRVLKQGLERDGGGVDVMAMIDEVKYLVLLSKLYFETGNWQQAVEDLGKAKEQQTRILKRGPSEVPDMIEQRKLAANICCQLGQFHQNQREFSKAIELYKEALSYSDNDPKIMLALAHMYLATGALDECNQQCQILLKIDKDNDQATLMLADLMYQRNEIDQASLHFSQLLDRNPNQYHALARCIELNWRNGDIEQAEKKYLKAAVERNPRATVDAGYNYCKGLHEWYTGDPNAALQKFNRARRDLEWGERAIYNMIEICLNPDNEIIGGEVFGETGGESGPSNDDPSREMGTRTAERFLKELRFKPGLDYKYRLMENFILLATKNKANIDEALKNFSQMAGGDNEADSTSVANVGAILGMARGYMMLKATPKAKAQLKRVINHPWTLDDADYLEQCWLLLADTYINQGKYDQATGILRTILQHNASCIKAFEYMGFLREKEQKWPDAAANYEEAWKISKRRNPTIGYKLAYNYLKSRRLFDAIEVCHRVLELYPNYPKIRRDIMDKARANIRM